MPYVRIASDAKIGAVAALSSGKVEIWGTVSSLNVASDQQVVSILGRVSSLNVSSAKEISIEKKAEVGAINIADESIKMTKFALVV